MLLAARTNPVHQHKPLLGVFFLVAGSWVAVLLTLALAAASSLALGLVSPAWAGLGALALIPAGLLVPLAMGMTIGGVFGAATRLLLQREVESEATDTSLAWSRAAREAPWEAGILVLEPGYLRFTGPAGDCRWPTPIAAERLPSLASGRFRFRDGAGWVSFTAPDARTWVRVLARP